MKNQGDASMRTVNGLSFLIPGVLATGLVCSGTAHAQQSPHFKLNEHVVNEGGRPAGGVILSSTKFHVTLDSIGDAVSARGLSSGSFHVNAGFVPAYPPPGEVTGLRFTDNQTLRWDPEPSVGDYNMYRDLVGVLPGLGFGVCTLQSLTGETAADPTLPPLGEAFFYLITVENFLDEEGTKGRRSNGIERTGNKCP